MTTEATLPPATVAAATTTREAYRQTLLELARSDSRIVCLDSDMGGLEDMFGGQLPDQYINVGIAEANLMGVAAGMAAAGQIPFVNTISGFAAARACEQVKVDIAYNDLPVRIVVTHGGLSAGHYGPTHHSVEDVAIMRTLPNMTVVVPADVAETVEAVRAVMHLPGPVFIRLGRKATAPVYDTPYPFTIGRAVALRDGDDVTLIATGPHPVLRALDAATELAGHGVSARVLNMHTVKPLDRDAVLAAARDTAGIVTVEDHVVLGGLGGAVCEVVAGEHPCPVHRIGTPDRFSDQVGGEIDLLTAAGVTAERIVAAALRLLA